jgi:CRISPR/Cas system CSM-associated protein Csm2 small subunit
MPNEQKSEQITKKLTHEIKEKNGLCNFDLYELLKPNGYAQQVIKENTQKRDEIKLTRVQLRKLFYELKYAYDVYKKNKEKEKVKIILYKLYPLVQYQVNRKLMGEDFKNLIWAILDTLVNNDKDFDKNLEISFEFLKSLVAYIPKEH